MLASAPARACEPIPPEPRLEGESDAVYEARSEALRRDEAIRALKERQTYDLQRADKIFIARDAGLWPIYNPRTGRGKFPPPPPPTYPFPSPWAFRPIAWLKGPISSAPFSVETLMSSCGPYSLGDTSDHVDGGLYVFFARAGKISGKTLIDAIAVDKIDDPTLAAFVAKYRKPETSPALSPR